MEGPYTVVEGPYMEVEDIYMEEMEGLYGSDQVKHMRKWRIPLTFGYPSLLESDFCRF